MEENIINNYEEETEVRATREQMKAEAIARMRMLHIFAPAIREFEEEGTLNYSEFRGILYWINNHAKYREAVDEFEKRTGALVYHAILSHTELGDMLSLLYVNPDARCWQYDRQDIRDGYAYAYVVNFDVPEYSEGGSIGIYPINGGVMRTA